MGIRVGDAGIFGCIRPGLAAGAVGCGRRTSIAAIFSDVRSLSGLIPESVRSLAASERSFIVWGASPLETGLLMSPLTGFKIVGIMTRTKTYQSLRHLPGDLPGDLPDH